MSATTARTIADEIRSEMSRQTKSGSDLAGVLGVNEYTATRRLRDGVDFAVTDLMKVAAWLNVPVDQFLSSCPTWCDDCSGWEGDKGVDGRTHQRHFAALGIDDFIELYATEWRDGRTSAAVAGLNAQVDELMAADLHRAAAALTEAANYMQDQGIG